MILWLYNNRLKVLCSCNLKYVLVQCDLSTTIYQFLYPVFYIDYSIIKRNSISVKITYIFEIPLFSTPFNHHQESNVIFYYTFSGPWLILLFFTSFFPISIPYPHLFLNFFYISYCLSFNYFVNYIFIVHPYYSPISFSIALSLCYLSCFQIIVVNRIVIVEVRY